MWYDNTLYMVEGPSNPEGQPSQPPSPASSPPPQGEPLAGPSNKGPLGFSSRFMTSFEKRPDKRTKVNVSLTQDREGDGTARESVTEEHYEREFGKRGWKLKSKHTSSYPLGEN